MPVLNSASFFLSFSFHWHVSYVFKGENAFCVNDPKKLLYYAVHKWAVQIIQTEFWIVANPFDPFIKWTDSKEFFIFKLGLVLENDSTCTMLSHSTFYFLHTVPNSTQSRQTLNITVTRTVRVTQGHYVDTQAL